MYIEVFQGFEYVDLEIVINSEKELELIKQFLKIKFGSFLSISFVSNISGELATIKYGSSLDLTDFTAFLLTDIKFEF